MLKTLDPNTQDLIFVKYMTGFFHMINDYDLIQL